MVDQVRIPQKYLDLINQVFEIEKKVLILSERNSINRNINRIKDLFEHDFLNDRYPHQTYGLVYHNPIGESYDETRTDCEASVSGTKTDNLEIVEVIKPLIFLKQGGSRIMVQKAVVVVSSKI